jgi:TatD DNase family protein
MSTIFETHAHYDDEAFNEDRDTLIDTMYNNNIGTIVNVGSSLNSTKQSIDLAHQYPFIYAAAGVHPSETAELDEDNFRLLERYSQDPKVIAIGEIGLDYYWKEPDHDTQKKWFTRQLELARQLDKPVIIHSREAAKDTYDIMQSANLTTGGIIHCYSYSPEMALDYVKLGYHIGIGGVITFKNGKKMRAVVEALPIERIVIETDSPYLSPEPHRGSRNSSLNLVYVIDKIAEIKNLTHEEVLDITCTNARKVYRLEE